MQLLKLWLLAALLAPITASAQTKTTQAQVKWGPELSTKDDGQFEALIGDVGNSTYLLMHRKKDVYIQRMDGLKMAWQKPIAMKLEKQDLALGQVLLTDDEVLVFTTSYDKKNNEYELFVSRYAQADLRPISELRRVTSMPAERSSNTGSFAISASPDRSKVLVQAQPPFDKKGQEHSTISVYGADMGHGALVRGVQPALRRQ